MVTKSFTCPNGHQWRDAPDRNHCPVCGADAETVGNSTSHLQSTGTGAAKLGTATATESKSAHFGRYRVIEELGRGGMGIVYRVFDPLHQRQVALKTLPTSDPALLSRFKREFRVLASVDHPHVVKFFELVSEADSWFFTMEIVEGVDLLNYVRHGVSQRGVETRLLFVEDGSSPFVTAEFNPFQLGEEQTQRLREGLSQLAGAIAVLHDSGIVHRDVKPTNVLVTPEGRVVLLDFGLLVETDDSGMHQSLHQQVLGTAAYMSPEQAACDPVSPASDWYSVGVMLYQMLTGRLPFSGKVLDILVKKQHQDPIPPREIEPSISTDLNDLCMELLSRRPEDRPDAEEILRRLLRTEHTVPRTIPSKEVGLVGRDTQLRTLRSTWQAVQAGQAKLVFVEGRSGTGKSTLVDAFIEGATVDGVVVLQGRCYEMESVPFKAIDSLVDSLVDYLRHLSSTEAATLMPRDVHALVCVFPVLGQLAAIASLPRRPIDPGNPQELNRRAIGALRELLARIGDRHPLVVYIDDLQWGDEDSAAMLTDLLQPPDPPVLFFLGTYRSEDTETSQFLQSFRQLQRQREWPVESLQIEVAPLDHADAVKLAFALLNQADADAQRSANAIAEEAGGNAFFVSELVKHLLMDGGRVTNTINEPLDLIDMIWSRVLRLPDESQRLLAVVALSGLPVPLEQAMRIADVGQAAIGPLRAGHFIRTIGLASAPKIETYHDRVRESVTQRLDHATKQNYHLRIAEDYVRELDLDTDEILNQLCEHFTAGAAPRDDGLDVVPAWYEVAFHYDAAGRSDRAFSFALATAERARTQFSLAVAEQQYRIAVRGMASLKNSVRCRLAEGLGDVLMLRGKYPEAAGQFETARNLVTELKAQARIGGKIGELAFKRGDNKTAVEALAQSLRLLGRKVPSHASGLLLLLAWEVVVQFLHTVFPKLFLNRRNLPGNDSEMLAIRLYIGLSYGYFFEHGKVPCLWPHLRAMNLAERYPPTHELGHVWATHTPVMSLIPWLRRGERYAKKSLAIRKELGDICGQGQSLHYLGVVLFVGARYDECITACREAIRLCEQTGDYWERNMAWWQSTNASFRRGDLTRAVNEAQRLYEACVEMGDDKVSGFALDLWSRASGGQMRADIVQKEVQRDRNDIWASALVLLAEGVRLVQRDELDEAIEVLNRAQNVCRKLGVNAWVSPIVPWLATAHRLKWQRTGTQLTHLRPLLNNARQAARRSLVVANKFRTDLPHALREAGLISAMQGSVRRARKHLDESLEVAQRQGAKFERAQTLLARGLVGLSEGWPGAAKEVADARQALAELGAEFVLAHYEMPK